MKICLIDYDMSAYGGVEAVTAQIANELRNKAEVCILSICGDKTAFALKEGVMFFSLEAGNSRLLRMRYRYKKSVHEFIKENQIDVVICMGAYAGIVSIPFLHMGKCRYIFSDHGALKNQMQDKKITAIRFLLAVFSDKITVLTRRNKEDYHKLFRVADKKITVIPNFISKEVFHHVSEYNEKSRLIVSSGRFGKEKGYDLLVKAAEIVLKENPDWEWHVYGDGDTFEEIRKQIQEKNLEERLVLKGRTDKMNCLYKEYAFFVLTSYREGLPMVLLEAQANHLPIVSFDVVTGPDEIVEDGVNGFLIPPYDTELMAEKISLLIRNENLRRSFSLHTYDNIDRFRSDVITDRWAELTDSMV